MVKSLNSLKNTLHKGSQIEILFHWRTESHGRIREVTVTNTQGFYSVVKDEPEHRDSLANNGKGTVLWWSNAPFWEFKDGVCSLYSSDTKRTEDQLILSFRILEQEET